MPVRLPAGALAVLLPVLLVCVLLITVGCSMGFGTSEEVESPGPREVFIKDSSFQPLGIQVTADSTVTWVNKDDIEHTVTIDKPGPGGSFDTIIKPGKTFKSKFSTAGVYSYHCNIHSSMHGEIAVTGCSADSKNFQQMHGAPPGETDCK